jgi:hypothetical protein
VIDLKTSSISQIIYGNESEAVNITTDRKTYNIDDIVNIIVNNTGTQPLAFTNETNNCEEPECKPELLGLVYWPC